MLPAYLLCSDTVAQLNKENIPAVTFLSPQHSADLTFIYFAATLFATLGSFGLGTVLSWSAPALPQLALQPHVRPSLVWPAGSQLRLDLEQQSWVASLLNFGAFTAGPISGCHSQSLLLHLLQPL